MNRTLAYAISGAIALALALGSVLVSGGAPAASGRTTVRPPVTIRLGEFFYKPRSVTVHVGQTVRFLNIGKIAHTVADTDARGNLHSRLIKPRPLNHGQAQLVRFAKPGIVYYLCTFHPTLMKGRIVVTR
jgi:plastocyanin